MRGEPFGGGVHGLAERSMALPRERGEPEGARLHRRRDSGRRGCRLAGLYAFRIGPAPPSKPPEPSRPAAADWPAAETIHITQSSPGTLIVGGVHGVPPEDFQRVSAEARDHPGRAGELLQGPGEAEGRARGPRQHPARVRQALQAARGGPEALHLRRSRGGGPQGAGARTPWRPASSIGPSSY